jgi:hypothetical protein
LLLPPLPQLLAQMLPQELEKCATRVWGAAQFVCVVRAKSAPDLLQPCGARAHIRAPLSLDGRGSFALAEARG